MQRFLSPLATYTAAWSLFVVACSEEKAVVTRRDAGVIVRRDASATRELDASSDDASRDVGGRIDAGGGPLLDAATMLHDEVRCTGPLPVMKVHDAEKGVDLEPDWSCYDDTDAGLSLADAGTRSTTFTADGILPGLLAGVTVDFFFGASTLGTPAVTRVFGPDAGSVSFDLPASTSSVSVRQHALARADATRSLAELRQYDLLVPPVGEPIQSYLVLNGSRDLIVNLALGGEREDPEKALLMSTARDCRGRNVSGGQFELIDGETNLPVETSTAPSAPRVSYFRDALPSTSCMFTSNDQAVWVLINAPVNVSAAKKQHSYRLRLKGRRSETDVSPVVLGEVEVETFAGVVSLVRTHRQTTAGAAL